MGLREDILEGMALGLLEGSKVGSSKGESVGRSFESERLLGAALLGALEGLREGLEGLKEEGDTEGSIEGGGKGLNVGGFMGLVGTFLVGLDEGVNEEGVRDGAREDIGGKLGIFVGFFAGRIFTGGVLGEMVEGNGVGRMEGFFCGQEVGVREPTLAAEGPLKSGIKVGFAEGGMGLEEVGWVEGAAVEVNVGPVGILVGMKGFGGRVRGRKVRGKTGASVVGMKVGSSVGLGMPQVSRVNGVSCLPGELYPIAIILDTESAKANRKATLLLAYLATKGDVLGL